MAISNAGYSSPDGIEGRRIDLMATFGLGGGIGIVKFLKYMPAPYQDSPWAGACFDWMQDLVSNHRIGDRRTRAGADVPPVPVIQAVPEPKAAPVEEEIR